MKEKRLIDELQTIHLDKNSMTSIIENVKSNKLKFYQFYGLESNVNEIPFYHYIKNFGHIDKKFYDLKILNKTYYDIETRYDPKKAPDPINTEFEITSIAIYNNIANVCHLFFLKDKKHDKNLLKQEKFNDEVIKFFNNEVKGNLTYEMKDMQIIAHVFIDEAELIESFFRKVLELNTLFKIGFNSSLFDDPYTVNRLKKLVGEEKAFSIISDFIVEQKGVYAIEQPEYSRADILKLYKPADQGGSGMGKSLPSYKLDYIANVELKSNKLDLEGDFNEIYLNDPVKFAVYNILDTILTYKLDDKLQFLESIYSLAKYNNASVRGVLIGRSFIFTYRNTFHYTYEADSLVRYNKFNKEVYYNV